MHREDWRLALELLSKFDGTVGGNAHLLYRLAMVHQKLGESEPAEAAAAKALAVSPDNLEAHLLVGKIVEETFAQTKWAEAEYRHVLERATPGTISDFSARFRLSDILHDRL